MKPQIIIDYQEYLKKIEGYKKLVDLLARVYFDEKISERLKNEISEMNNLYGWWI